MGALRFAASGTSAALGASTLPPSASASASARVAIAQRESAAPQLLQVSLLLFPHLPSPPSHLHPLFVPFHDSQSLPVNTYSYLDDGKTYICPFSCDPTAFTLHTTRDSLCQPRRAPAPPNLPASSPVATNFAIGSLLQQCANHTSIARLYQSSQFLTSSRPPQTIFSAPTFDRSPPTLGHLTTSCGRSLEPKARRLAWVDV